jgi:hypothetical protein
MRLWVNKARTVLVSEMDDGNLTVALRDEEGDIWGPPVLCVSERDEGPTGREMDDRALRLGRSDNPGYWHRGSRA